MAEYGFLTLAFDPSFTGESGGQPRYGASPNINIEDFCAAVDFLSVQDTRIKATAAMTMYDMTRVNANGYFDSEDTADARYEKRRP